MYIVENYGLAVALCWVTCFAGVLGEILKSWQRKLGGMNFFIGIMSLVFFSSL